jgi:hypothetical protein
MDALYTVKNESSIVCINTQDLFLQIHYLPNSQRFWH